jgi:hypothetical protein
MKRIMGLMFYVLAVVIGVFVTLLLFLQVLTTIGLMTSNGKEPGLFFASFCFLFGAMLTIFLFRLGHNILQNKNELSVGAKIYLLMIGIAVDVVIFMKSAIPFLTQGHGIWFGSFTLLSMITFAALCWMFTKV